MLEGDDDHRVDGFPLHMLHDRLRGRITWSSEGGTKFVVDGIEIDMDDLASLLGSHEGWTFELRLADGPE